LNVCCFSEWFSKFLRIFSCFEGSFCVEILFLGIWAFQKLGGFFSKSKATSFFVCSCFLVSFNGFSPNLLLGFVELLSEFLLIFLGGFLKSFNKWCSHMQNEQEFLLHTKITLNNIIFNIQYKQVRIRCGQRL
jgi:hypothetical protein